MSNDVSAPFQIEHLGPWSDLGRHTFGPLVGKVFTRESLGLTGCELSLHLVKAGEGTLRLSQYVASLDQNLEGELESTRCVSHIPVGTRFLVV